MENHHNNESCMKNDEEGYKQLFHKLKYIEGAPSHLCKHKTPSLLHTWHLNNAININKTTEDGT